MNKLNLGVAVAAIAFAASPAMAQGANNKAGGRLELIAGYDRVGFDLEDTFGIDDSLHMDGVVYGIGVGYDVPVAGNMKLGVDLEASDATTRRKATFTGIDNGSMKISAGRDLYAGARLTVAASDKVNVYFKAGYTNARLKASVKGTFDGETVDESAGANGDGVRLGAGAQFAIRGNTYLGLEYRYSNYEADVTRNQLAATLGFRF